jgi:hypothetical protein
MDDFTLELVNLVERGGTGAGTGAGHD